MVNLLLLVAGSFMEATSVVLIFAPILFPIATALGIDPVHLGIIMTVNMEIGMVTPPVGLNLFVTSGIAGMPVTRVVRAARAVARGAARGARARDLRAVDLARAAERARPLMPVASTDAVAAGVSRPLALALSVR